MPPFNGSSPKPVQDNRNARTPNSRPSSSKGSGVNGLGISARGSLSRPSRGGSSRPSPRPDSSSASTAPTDEQDGDEARAGNIALLDELRERARRAETRTEELQGHLNLLQARLDESQQAQSRLEEQLQDKDLRVEEMELEKVQATRSTRDMETLYESERAALFKEKEEQSMREDEMQETITRLKQHLMEREPRGDRYNIRDVPQQATEQFAPTMSPPPPADSDELTKTITHKDKVIESLRLELAEAQIKIMEMDSAGGGNVRDIEKKLMETKIENARLLEDNESYQLLLSEKTLNGDFAKADAMQASSPLGSLAEELGSEDLENAEDKSESTKRLELELKSVKEQNKALTVYIDKILGRLLTLKDFDNILDKNPDLLAGPAHPASAVPAGSDMPPTPPPKDSNAGAGFLSRTRSVLAGGPRRPRPLSQIQNTEPIAPAPASAGPTQDPSTAPSIPIGRSTSVRHTHKRTQSEIPNNSTTTSASNSSAAVPLAHQMYRGASSSGLSQPLGSPGLSPSSTVARTSFFSPTASTTATSRAPSGSASRHSTQNVDQKGDRPMSSSGSTFSDKSGGALSGSGHGGMGIEGSPPRVPNNYTGAVMTQNRLRPLRLVQENKEGEEERAEAVAARKKANRTSWMPNWMGQRGGGGVD